jgi:hypothetical protein
MIKFYVHQDIIFTFTIVCIEDRTPTSGCVIEMCIYWDLYFLNYAFSPHCRLFHYFLVPSSWSMLEFAYFEYAFFHIVVRVYIFFKSFFFRIFFFSLVLISISTFFCRHVSLNRENSLDISHPSIQVVICFTIQVCLANEKKSSRILLLIITENCYVYSS